jgi:hypothetical protein
VVSFAGAALAVGGGAAARQGFQNLFNGKDLAGWHLRNPDGKNGWKVENGVLTNTPPSGDLVSDQKFGNFDLQYEYRIPKDSNSGLYLRGRYEIQIMDSFGKQPESHQDGAIYGQFQPSTITSKPVGEWNVMEVKLVGQHVTVTQNGKKTIDAELNKGVTGGALDTKENQPGPIFLQGDHGVVSFRNIRIKPL